MRESLETLMGRYLAGDMAAFDALYAQTGLPDHFDEIATFL